MWTATATGGRARCRLRWADAGGVLLTLGPAPLCQTMSDDLPRSPGGHTAAHAGQAHAGTRGAAAPALRRTALGRTLTALLLVLLFVLILLNGFFVAAEFALVRARRTRMEEAAKEGSRSAELALHQMDHIDQYLSAAQVGITMTSIGLGFLGEPAVASLLEPVFGGVDEPRRRSRSRSRSRTCW